MGFAAKHPVPYRIASLSLRFSLVMIAIIAVIALAGSAINVAVVGLWRMFTGG